jgi:hypothetical protein
LSPEFFGRHPRKKGFSTCPVTAFTEQMAAHFKRLEESLIPMCMDVPLEPLPQQKIVNQSEALGTLRQAQVFKELAAVSLVNGFAWLRGFHLSNHRNQQTYRKESCQSQQSKGQ